MIQEGPTKTASLVLTLKPFQSAWMRSAATENQVLVIAHCA